MPESLPETIVRASRPVRYAAAAALTVLALFLLVKTFDAIDQFGTGPNRPINSITVSGEGKSTSIPNIAQITFTVQETAASVKDAQDAATKRTNDSLAAMKTMGIEEKDIKTLGYNVYPQYENRAMAPCYPGSACPTQSNKISGYQVSQTVQVKVRDTAKAGDVLQQLGTFGVQNISGPDFMLDDDSTVTDEARAEAIKDAREKAELLAKQLHVRLGDVISFSEGGGYYPMYSGYAKGGVAMDAAVAPSPSLPVGENETNVTVQVTYEIR
ncbi:MAG: hypothetical protein AB203_04135 [Parcubacteria bacterium C7867-008]|nr:MAG: hypothetical protein AB203_04135 [Parcubacteria bacterium C7867-008]